MRFKTGLILFLICFQLPNISYAQLGTLQNYKNRIETLSIEEGLSNNLVTSILQDKDGFIWVGTRVGLNKYDAYSFKHFQYEIDKKSSLSCNYIQDIFIDNENQMWVSTWGGGINIFNREKQTFSVFNEINKQEPFTLHDHIYSVYQAKNKSFWFANLANLIHYFPDTKKYDVFWHEDTNENTISDKWIMQIFETSKTELYFVSSDGVLNKFDEKKSNFHRFELYDYKIQKERISIIRVFEDSENSLLICTTKGLYVFNQKTDSFHSAIPSHNKGLISKSLNISTLLEYSHGIIWAGTDDGIIELERNNNHYSIIEDHKLLEGFKITEIYKDFQGNIWIGSKHKGLRVIFNKKKHFYYINLETGPVHAITKDNNENLWLGTINGLIKYNLLTKKSNRITLKDGLSSNIIRSMYINERNQMLVGSDGGLYLLDLATEKTKKWKDNKGLLNTPIVIIKQDNKGNYWMGSDKKGLIFIDQASKEVSNFTSTPGIPFIGTDNVTSICFEDDNKILVGIFGGGLNIFDRDSMAFVERYLHDPKKESSINDNNILDIHKDLHNNIWIATNDGGISHFNKKNSVFTPYTKKDGLPSNTVYDITGDTMGNLWFCSSNGLAKFNTKTRKTKYFDSTDGLLSNLFTSQSSYVDQKGYIYLGTNNGVNYFLPEKIKENTDEPKLCFTNFKIFNKPVELSAENSPLHKHISLTDSIVLKHDQTAITIEYTALNFISSSKNKYKYKMEGLEDHWLEVDNQRSANYSNIPPGNYCFKVNASNNDGYWTSEPLCLHIKVLPPPWKSNLAYAIYIILFLGLNILLILFVRWLTKRKHDLQIIHIQREKEKQLSQFKLQFFTNISHELRTHLTLIAYPINKLLKRKAQSVEDKKELSLISLNIKRLSTLTDEIIDFRKVEQGKTKLVLQKSNIVDFIHEIKKLFDPIAEENGINFEYKPEKKEIIWCFDLEKLKKILFNLISNAFKYTPDGGRIKIYIKTINDPEQKEQKLVIGIKDNGIGINNENLHHIFDRFYNPGEMQKKYFQHDSSGIGLALVKQLVELHGGKVNVHSKKNIGSHFYICLKSLELPPDAENIASEIDFSNLKGQENWEDILKIKRSNIQDELIIKNELKSLDLPTILIVDDNKEICRILNETFKDKYQLFFANTGKEALKIVEKEIINIVLSDVMMPDLNGIGLCKILKNNIKTSHIAVVLLTAKAGLDNELIGLRTGADAYISKPFNEEKIRLIVENILKTQLKLQSIASKKKSSDQISEPGFSPIDAKLIDRISKIINQKMTDPDFSVDELGKEIGLSRMHLYRKTKALLGYSPSDFIKKIRLEKSKKLIKEGKLSISDIAYDTGFSTPGNFSTTFKKFFGQTPAQYRNKCFK